MIAAIEQELAQKFGTRLEPIKAPLSQRTQYARLAKLTEEPYHIKGGCGHTDRAIRDKTGTK